MVDGRGFEPPTSALRTPRSPTELTAHAVPIMKNRFINLPLFDDFFYCSAYVCCHIRSIPFKSYSLVLSQNHPLT